ncbi:MAG: NAD(P)/FAD-dependent oxidoreductase [Candidatus Methanoplasma sp.]|jgi:thioredoxin reductase (NADPH)|nr:NAD(P)/FAD-dependent oxidoreductase [Candidatus Methanoplasma sp.]
MNADVVIIGCGPAGLQAGIHSSRKKADTVIVGKIKNSALYDAHIENYFGIAGKTDGPVLLEKGLEQALSFGCRHIDMDVTRAAAEGSGFRITVESGEEIFCRSVVIATGISRMKLNIPGEKEFLGKGVSYCAECDCNFYKGLRVAVIGGGSKAALASELMTGYASVVYWVSKKISADKSLVNRALKTGVRPVTETPKVILGEDRVRLLLLEDGREIEVDGIFIELGGRSSADIAMDLGVMPEADDSVRINNKCETSVTGVFACGDITGEPWQLAKAVGEGAVAGLNAAGGVKGIK